MLNVCEKIDADTGKMWFPGWLQVPNLLLLRRVQLAEYLCRNGSARSCALILLGFAFWALRVPPPCLRKLSPPGGSPPPPQILCKSGAEGDPTSHKIDSNWVENLQNPLVNLDYCDQH